MEATIHDDLSLQTIEKINYLREYLEDEALKSVAGLEMTNANYEAVINHLKERYGKGEILKDLSLDYIAISETKLDESFPNSQFKLNGYEVRARRDRHKHGGGLIEFVRQGFIC